MSFTNYLHKLVFPLIILLLAYLPLAGQTPYVFRHLKVENGLSNNNVKTILKDCEGFLWIGTANGLNRYDGYSFKVYQPKEKDIHSLLSNDIWNLQEDGLGNLQIPESMNWYDRWRSWEPKKREWLPRLLAELLCSRFRGKTT